MKKYRNETKKNEGEKCRKRETENGKKVNSVWFWTNSFSENRFWVPAREARRQPPTGAQNQKKKDQTRRKRRVKTKKN